MKHFNIVGVELHLEDLKKKKKLVKLIEKSLMKDGVEDLPVDDLFKLFTELAAPVDLLQGVQIVPANPSFAYIGVPADLQKWDDTKREFYESVCFRLLRCSIHVTVEDLRCILYLFFDNHD